jgi:hypothetical protein
MIKKMALRFLLGRGIGRLQELLSKSLRHGLTTGGGALVAGGHMAQDDLTTVIGGAAVALGAVLSYARTYLSERLGN